MGPRSKLVILLGFFLILQELGNMSSGCATDTKVDRMDTDIENTSWKVQAYELLTYQKSDE